MEFEGFEERKAADVVAWYWAGRRERERERWRRRGVWSDTGRERGREREKDRETRRKIENKGTERRIIRCLLPHRRPQHPLAVDHFACMGSMSPPTTALPS